MEAVVQAVDKNTTTSGKKLDRVADKLNLRH